jgi:hypothetical protein
MCTRTLADLARLHERQRDALTVRLANAEIERRRRDRAAVSEEISSANAIPPKVLVRVRAAAETMGVAP